jgi:hypothetical protein
VRYGLSLVCSGYSAVQAMSGIRSHAPHLSLAPVKRKCKDIFFRHPKNLIECFHELCGFGLQVSSAFGAAEPPIKIGHTALGHVHIALRFHKSDRPFGRGPVRMHYRMLGILPSVIVEA